MLLPLRDSSIRGARIPVITNTLLFVNVAVHYLIYYRLSAAEAERYLDMFSVLPRDILGLRHVYTLFTCQFLHGDLVHLISNMVFLYIFGDNIEVAFGRRSFLRFYLTGGAIAALAHVFTSPEVDTRLLGASGAIAACMGAYIILFARSRVYLFFFPLLFWSFPVRAWVFLGYWIAVQVLYYQGMQDEPIAYMAHIAGFMAGAVEAIARLKEVRAKGIILEGVDRGARRGGRTPHD